MILNYQNYTKTLYVIYSIHIISILMEKSNDGHQYVAGKPQELYPDLFGFANWSSDGADTLIHMIHDGMEVVAAGQEIFVAAMGINTPIISPG